MGSGFNESEKKITFSRNSTITSLKGEKSVSPKIAGLIGKGEDAKNSFVYLTLVWSFRAGIVVSVLIFINGWCFRENEKVPDVMNDVSIAWELVVPLVTLALGYAFGKSKD